MPCVSLKHRQIYREQILPCIMARVNAKKARKSAPVKQNPAAAAAPINTNTSKSLGFQISKKRPTRADLLNAESQLGSRIFGPIPAGHRREFFHDERNIWIWYESWTDEAANYHEQTVRYEVCPSGVYKKVSAGSYFRLEGGELENFRQAARAYLQIVKQNLYNFA